MNDLVNASEQGSITILKSIIAKYVRDIRFSGSAGTGEYKINVLVKPKQFAQLTKQMDGYPVDK